jgi:hypothetical protein
MENFNYAFISNKNNIENMTDINDYNCNKKEKVLLNLKIKLEKLKDYQETIKYNNQKKEECDYLDNQIKQIIGEIDKIKKEPIRIESVNNKNSFLKQFDDLSYDRKGSTLAANESSRDINSSLNRDIELNNGFSSFNSNKMDYGILKGNMKHDNMVQFTSSRSVGLYDLDRDTRKLENHTGNGRYWKHKKEKENLFKPKKGLSNINGMKNYSHKIVNRVNSSFYKNSERLDNINKRIAPGLKGKNQIGLTNNARIMPLSVDDLRTLDNPKTTYDGVTLESGMKGHLGKRKSEITRIKKKDFKEMKREDLVRPKKTVLNRTLHGQPNLKDTDRSVSMAYAGTAANKHTIINSKNDFLFNESAKSSYNFKPLPAKGIVKNLNNTNSFKNYENERLTTQSAFIGNPNADTVTYNNTFQAPDPTLKEQLLHSRQVGLNVENNNYVNIMEAPDTTLKEQLLHSRQLGINVENNNYVNTMQAPDITLKEQLLHNRQLGINVENNNYVNTMEKPETTLKEQLNHNRQMGINMGIKSYNNTLERPEITLKEQLNHNRQMSLNMNTKSYNNTLETPEITLKEQLLHNRQLGINVENNNYVNTMETPETTLKEQLNHNRQMGINMAQKGYNNTLETPETTLKEQLLHNRQIGLNVENNNYVNTFEAPESTIKEQTLHNRRIAINTEKNNYVNTYCAPDPTIKETTMIQNYNGNIENNRNNYTRSKNMEMRPTIKETTLFSHVGTMDNNKSGAYFKNKDIAKPTIKETTLTSRQGNAGSNTMTTYTGLSDKPKMRQSETYQKNKHLGTAKSINNKKVSYEADLNITIKSINGLKLNDRDSYGGKEQIGAGKVEKGLFKSNRNNLNTNVGTNGYKDLNLTSGTVKTTYTRDPIEYENKNKINPFIKQTLNKNPLVNNVVFKSFIQ